MAEDSNEFLLGDGDKSWREYRRLILSELDRINVSILSLNTKLERFHNEEIGQLRVDIAMLQVKSGVWGAMAGLAVAIGAALLKFVTGH